MLTPLARFTGGLVAGVLAGGLLSVYGEEIPADEPVAQPLSGLVEATAAAATVASGPTPPAPGPTPTPIPACEPASLAERAGAVLVVGLPGVTDADDPLAEQVLGADVGGILLTKSNVETSEQVSDLVAGLRAQASGPLLITTDEEPGRVSSFGELIGRSSSARTLAARGDLSDVREFAAELGSELAAFDVDVALAPVADLDDGPSQGVIGDRSFSIEPETAAGYARAFAYGLAEAGVLPTAKHFPGHGLSRTDSHREPSLVEIELDELHEADLVPFAEQIDADVPVVMLGHVAYTPFDDELPASLAPEAYELLRDMGFEGVAMTDSVGMGAVNLRWPFPEAAVMAVAAGADAVLATDGNHAVTMRDALVAAVSSGDLEESRLDEAVARMQHLKGADPTGLVCVQVAFPDPMQPPSATISGR